MDNETKGLLQSKTFWGVVVMAIAGVLRPIFGIVLPEETQQAIAHDLTVAAGAFLAIWGRIAASAKIDRL